MQICRTSLLLLCLFPILTANGLGGQEPSPMEPKHIAKLRYVSSAAVAPDGSSIAYTLAVPRPPLQTEDGPAWSELFVTDQVGNSRPFITGEVSIGTPQWAPDGRWIYYAAKRTGDEVKVLYRIAVDGGESICTWTHGTSITGFDISPDGKSIAFLATATADQKVKALREQGFDQEIYEEDWQPTRVWIAAIDPTSAEPAPETKARLLDLEGSASNVKWSPNGKELLVVLAPTPGVDDSYMHQQVHVVEAGSGRIIRSLNNQGKLGDVAWSPDGKRVALVSGADIHDPKEGRLLVTTVDGAPELTDLLPDLNAHVNSIAWKDNATLLWLAEEGVASRLGSVTLERESEVLIPPGETVFDDFVRGSASSTVALLGQNPSHPTELFIAEDEHKPPQRVTDSNPWLGKLELAKQTEITWNARDGLKLQGVLMYPLGYVEGRRYPTIMYVHGGPESHESNGWLTSYTRPGQVAAARGFAVFYPNYRGSTGRGVEFSKLGQADAAGKEFDDLVDGIDHLIELGIADPDAVGVTGGSYGGYASAWCATYYSERFSASVMFVGISDNVSKVGTTDIPDEMYLVHHRKHLWDDWDYFLERSPIRHVEKNQTPTLILHGKNDPRVHPSQSLELHRHLKTLDQAPVRLVLYEGEGHGNRKAAARLDYNLRMLRWMEHFLQQRDAALPDWQLDYRAALGIEESE